MPKITADDIAEARILLDVRPKNKPLHLNDAEYLAHMLGIGLARAKRLLIAVEQNTPTDETPGMKSQHDPRPYRRK